MAVGAAHPMTGLARHLEHEEKFSAHPRFDIPDLGGAIAGALCIPQPLQSFETVYYDTRDLRLARWGISVRCRTGETRLRKGWGRWTVKLPESAEGNAVRRHELVVDAPSRAVPEAVASLVRAYVRSALLAPIAVLRTERRPHVVRLDDDDLFEIDDDEVSIVEEGRIALRFREIEVERLDRGDEKGAAAIARALEEAGAQRTPGTSKVAQALGPEVLGEPEVVAHSVGRSSTIGEVAQAAIADATIRLLRRDPGLRLGGDPDDVHQARVATRRLRSDLRTFDDVLDREPVDAMRNDLAWLADLLGACRDADVLLERLRAHAQRLSPDDQPGVARIVRRLEAERDDAGAALRDALDDRRYLSLLDVLVQMSRQPPLVGDHERPAVDVLAATVHRQWKKLAQTVEAVDDDAGDAALHPVRIHAKRARYAAEASTAVCGKRAARLATSLADLQSVLGELNDAVAGEAWLRRAAARSSGSAAFAAGLLVAIERDARREARMQWKDVWSKAARKRRRWRS